MPDTPDQPVDPLLKAGHLMADTVINAHIDELRRLIAGSEQRIVELEELKHATLEDKGQVMRSSPLP